ncbi:TPA: stage II sporulation protein R [Bacillus anthracis]|uniref:stage II sporulation protein R n=1 Tax=Bacillus anthracis TaxID=1392 RepID=UPI0001DBF8C2|nr:stage II sporulation protein R [Bacillus cereus]HDR4492396.1 stage II sporulation protein R [Bacillus cereus biovar anthracis]ADK07868.1 stage II sporulation protein R [Bacillus cereus biovar anthracis str. CI]HDR6229841.1 stage II sporulation protein R [Bacillus cereus biovar anthracis]HDR6234484.1 stage II sporulation protein R [Bacillus cereus biovar anthracis]HDR6240862.1 stage II sporulation protein R [Bacillus cereus biovar anthracis]
MKKQVIAYLLLLLIGAQLLVQFGYMKADAKGPSVIPKEAVRLRILANSDSDKDQALKRKVRDEVKAQIDGWVADLTSFEEARKVIQSHIPEIEKTVANTLKKEGSKDSFQVKFSKNVKFPTKVYGNFIYPAGEYEAVLITIGEGEGANWWCVLFPPMCFLDFSSGTAVRKEEHVVKAESPEEEQVKQIDDEEVVDTEEKKEDEVKEKKVVKQEVATKVTASEKKVEEQPVSKEETKTVEKVEKPVEQKQEKQNEYVKVEEEEEEAEVKLFIVEAFTSLFSK